MTNTPLPLPPLPPSPLLAIPPGYCSCACSLL